VGAQLSSYGDADWLVREITCICSGELWVLWKVMTFYVYVGAYKSKVAELSSLTLLR